MIMKGMLAKPLVSCLVCLALAVISPADAVQSAEKPKPADFDKSKYNPPNIVLILFDAARKDTIGVYSEKNVSTPNIDTLANEGVRFNNAYTPTSLCSPARASILTGLYPHAHGLRKVVFSEVNQTDNLPPNVDTVETTDAFADDRFKLGVNFPSFVTISGYATAYIGKWHLGVSNPGFFDLFKAYESGMPHWTNEPNRSAYREDLKTDEGIRFIKQNSDRPLFLYLSYYTPIHPYQPPQKYLDLFKDRDIDNKKYYAAMSSLDYNVGRIVKTLEEQKLLDNTLLIISADHGKSFRKRPGSIRGGSTAYEEAAGIPMIMHWPDGLPKNVQWESGVSLVDLAPTILSAANIKAYNNKLAFISGRDYAFHGRDLISEVNLGKDSWPTPIFMQNLPDEAIEGSWYDERSMRSEKWKLTLRDLYADPRLKAKGNALFEITKDPEEVFNRYYQPQYQGRVKQQLNLMLEYAEKVGDSLAIKLAAQALKDI